MALYAGLSPTDALSKWYSIRQKSPDQMTPEELQDYQGNMVGLSQQNPAAWKTVATGINDNGKTRQVFNPNTGNWDNQQVHGYWSHPESWMQLAFGAGLGGVAAAGALAGPAAAGGSAAGTTGSTVPVIGTLPNVAASGAIPSALGSGGGLGLGTNTLVNAGINAGKTKLQGGSWTDAAKSAGMSAMPGTGGTSGFLQSAFGNIPADIGMGLGVYNAIRGGGGGGNQSAQPSSAPTQPAGGIGPTQPSNLAQMMMQGRKDALMNQPFRTNNFTMPLAGNNPNTSQGQIHPLPNIYPNFGPGGGGVNYVNGVGGGIGPGFTNPNSSGFFGNRPNFGFGNQNRFQPMNQPQVDQSGQ